MNISQIKRNALEFDKEIQKIKKLNHTSKFDWYPYGSMNNFIHLNNLLSKENRDILDIKTIKTIIDIGSADGDNSFFLEKLGFNVDIMEYAPTNYNSLQGAKLLKKILNSSVNIYETNLDSQFKLTSKYDLAFFLGILYHLKNPFYALETLAKSCRYCFLSTRVIKYAPDRKSNISDFSPAYLVDEKELNNDSTNYWMFTTPGLKRICNRAGWNIIDYITVGNTKYSDPVSTNGDERAFCLLKSKLF